MDTAINTTAALVTINASALPTILSADKDDILGKLMSELGNFNPDGSTEAAERERAKIVAQQKAEADERARRERDVENRKAVNNAALVGIQSVIGLYIDESHTEVAKAVLSAIIKGKVPYVSITY